jgi:triacylglycerol lipase
MRSLGRIVTGAARTTVRATAATVGALTGPKVGSRATQGVGTTTDLGGRSVLGSARGDDRPPVVLAHGYLDGHLSPWWDQLTGLLGESGLSTDRCYTADTPTLPGVAVGHPSRYAEGLRAALERAHDHHDRPATVIGHSMGGLVGRYHIEREGGGDAVDHLVTLGTPHQGTYTAYLGYLTAGGRALAPGSEFLTELNGTPLHPDVRYTSLYSRADPLVQPAESGRIPEDIATDRTENIRTGWQSHVQLVQDPGVFDHYADRLA